MNQQNAEKKTPLMLACMLEGDFTEKEKVDLLVSLLVEHGASDEAEDKEGWTALHHACSNKHHEPIRRMLGVGLGNVDCMTRECISPLIIACMQVRKSELSILYTLYSILLASCFMWCGALDRQLWCSSIASFNITSIAYNHHTDICPLLNI